MTYTRLFWGSVLIAILQSCASAPAGGDPASADAAGQADSAPLQFTEISQEAGLALQHQSGAYGEFFMPEIMGGGVAFLDYDGDQDPDILLIGGGAWEKSPVQGVQSLYLFENQGDGTYQDVSKETGLSQLNSYAFGATIGDIDNDGDDDIYVTALKQNLLLLNEGGVFVESGKKAGLQGKSAWSTASIFFDADRDGFLDIYVGNYVQWSQEIDRNIWCSIDGETDNYCHPNLYTGEQGVFYRNNGDGTFTDETASRGFVGANGLAPIKTLGAVALDVDADGWMDLILANDMQPDLLFHNRGDGTFEEVGTAAGIAYNRKGKARAGMGIVAGDLDNSGYPSLIVGNFSGQPISVFKSMPNGMFIDQAYSSQIGKPSFLTLTFGLSLFDADLDGDQDLFAANGHVFTDIDKKSADISFRQPPHFFVNDGTGKFTDQAPAMGGLMQDSLVARSSAVADIDGDGDLDVLLSENNGPFHLLRNDTRGGNYIRLLLRSQRGNPNAIGAVVIIYETNGQPQMKTVQSADGYLSQSEFALTFGLGAIEGVDSILVRWPDGSRETFSNLAVNQLHTIEAGKGAAL